jgi:demethylmenaquinone methyltransferase / 2-methoxy-6-polyprenyl-1,4-benzoquinol methylase
MPDPATKDPAGSPAPKSSGRFAAHASGEMASMFDHVSDRYDLLNRLMTLGQDRAWRAAMWREVPDDARIVLDLCTGNGVSLTGLRRPGRLVLGVDVSLGMLESARAQIERGGWAPRLAAADAFRLPLRNASVDAVTIAFGVRNLRPRIEALREIARVLVPGGTLAVLEATAPAPGWLAPLHAFHVRHVIPAAGKLSPDPTAYQYLSRSIFEFGDGEEFERDLEAARFEILDCRSFMLGATRLWTVRMPGETSNSSPARPGSAPAERSPALRNATREGGRRSELPQPRTARDSEWKWWKGIQLANASAILIALIYCLWAWLRTASRLPLPLWQRRGLLALILAGIVLFGVRTGILLAGLRQPRGR